MNPKLTIDLKKLQENMEYFNKKCEEHNIVSTVVTKVFCANEKMVEVLSSTAVEYLADSRVQNLKKMEKFPQKKLLLRLPMLSEVDEVVKYADVSLNSELKTLEMLDEAARKQDKIHSVILMKDLGDLREGFFDENEFLEAVSYILNLKNIELKGIGVNLTCYGAVIPKYDNLIDLVRLKDEIESRFNITLELISGGNSSSVYLLDKGEMPKGINHLRLGECVVLGRETAYGQDIGETHQDIFTLSSEIVELKEKPSLPIGEIGVDAFGQKPEYEDRGIRKRAILAIGKQDTDIGGMIPIDDKIDILGASSDHLIMDVTDSQRDYKIGDTVEFKLEYGALLKLFTSEYVTKEYI